MMFYDTLAHVLMRRCFKSLVSRRIVHSFLH